MITKELLKVTIRVKSLISIIYILYVNSLQKYFPKEYIFVLNRFLVTFKM